MANPHQIIMNWKLKCNNMPAPAGASVSKFVERGHKFLPESLDVRSFWCDRNSKALSSTSSLQCGRMTKSSIHNIIDIIISPKTAPIPYTTYLNCEKHFPSGPRV